jgi:hypothetical protein
MIRTTLCPCFVPGKGGAKVKRGQSKSVTPWIIASGIQNIQTTAQILSGRFPTPYFTDVARSRNSAFQPWHCHRSRLLLFTLQRKFFCFTPMETVFEPTERRELTFGLS